MRAPSKKTCLRWGFAVFTSLLTLLVGLLPPKPPGQPCLSPAAYCPATD